MDKFKISKRLKIVLILFLEDGCISFIKIINFILNVIFSTPKNNRNRYYYYYYLPLT